MAQSTKTLTVLERNLVNEKDDLYPDRSATPASDGSFPIRDTGAQTYRHGDEVPTTTKDMNKLFKWEHGDEIYGSQAKNHEGMKAYMKDINKAFGKQGKYKDIYIDIYDPNKPVSKQLEELK
jgi:hypothetical protein